MSSVDKLRQFVSAELPESLAAEILDFAEFAAGRDAGRKREAFAEWLATAPVDNEPLTAEEAAAVQQALSEPGSVPADELYRKLGL